MTTDPRLPPTVRLGKAAGRPSSARPVPASPETIEAARRVVADADRVLKARAWVEAQVAARRAQDDRERAPAGALASLEALAKAAVDTGAAPTLEQAMAEAALSRPDLVATYRGLR